MEFKVGKWYRIIRPKTEKDQKRDPGWLSEMDKYDGKSLFCKRIVSHTNNQVAFLEDKQDSSSIQYAYSIYWVKEDSLSFFRWILGGNSGKKQ